MNPTLRRRLRWVAAAVAVVVTAGVFAWAWGSAPINLRERIFAKNLAEVEGGWLYRSGQIRPNLIEGTLRDLDIDLIVDLSHDLGDRDASQKAERAAVAKLGIEVKRFPMHGTGIGTVDNYVGAIAAIVNGGREGKHVLLHCRAGDKRTGGVLAAYAILVKGESVADAQAELIRFTPPTSDANQLMHFLDENLPAIGQGLIAAGVIQRLPDPLPTFASL